VPAPHSRHQSLVCLAEEPQAEGKSAGKSLDPVIESRDVVAHLLDVVAQLSDPLVVASLKAQEIGDLGLRTFDSRAEDRLEPT